MNNHSSEFVILGERKPYFKKLFVYLRMQIKHKEIGSKGIFYLEENGEKLAEMTYSKAGEALIIIDHTEVSEKLKGQGAGKQLVQTAVNYAREHSIKILPLCPFAKATFDKTAEYSDVLSS